eukprot:COSAG05_NODE_1537_length_4608_cov_57.827456_2_plen_396_part_00
MAEEAVPPLYSGGTVGIYLTKEEKASAQIRQIARSIATAMKSGRSLYGTRLTDAQSVFDAIDRDGSQQIDRDEFRRGLGRMGLGVADSQLSQLVATLDRNADGVINFSEFVQLFNGLEGVDTGPQTELRTQLSPQQERARSSPPINPKPAGASNNQDTEQVKRVAKALLVAMQAGRSLYGRKLTTDVQTLFDAIDDNGSRSIDRDEFQRGLSRLGLGLADSQLSLLMAAVDRNGNGTIEFDEFSKMLSGLKFVDAVKGSAEGKKETARIRSGGRPRQKKQEKVEAEVMAVEKGREEAGEEKQEAHHMGSDQQQLEEVGQPATTLRKVVAVLSQAMQTGRSLYGLRLTTDPQSVFNAIDDDGSQQIGGGFPVDSIEFSMLRRSVFPACVILPHLVL